MMPYCFLVVLLSLAPIAQTSVVDEIKAESVFEKNACGPISLAVVAQHIDRPELFDDIFRLLPPSGEPRSLNDLRLVAKKLGLETKAVRWRQGVQPDLTSPAIIRLEPSAGRDIGHFVVLTRAATGRIQVFDVPGRPHWISPEQLWAGWDGTALHIATSLDLLPKPVALLQRWFGCAAFGLGLASLGLISFRKRIDVSQMAAWKFHYSSLAAWRFALLGSVCGAILASVGLCAIYTLPARSLTHSRLDFTPEFAVATASAGGGKVTVEYQIQNNRNKPAKIGQIESSCGCATPHITSSTIPAGGQAVLSVALQPSARSGSRNFRIYVRFAQPAGEVLELCGLLQTR